MLIEKVNILMYKGEEVGYRVVTVEGTVDVVKTSWDALGGVDYSKVGYITLFDSGSLIASEDEIASKKYVEQLVDTAIVDSLYASYISDLGSALIDGKYIVTEKEIENARGCVEVFRLGFPYSVATLNEMSNYGDIELHLHRLAEDMGVSLNLMDKGDSCEVCLGADSLVDIEYIDGLDYLSYTVRYLIKKVIKHKNSK